MHHAVLASETDFDGWRQTARALVHQDVMPEQVIWSVAGGEVVLFPPSPPPATEPPSFRVPAAFLELARDASLNRDTERFAILYRVLWRLRDHRNLLEVATDPDVMRLNDLARAVRRDQHKMHAFVRFRAVGEGEAHRFIAWFEPDHHIVEAVAPFFEDRFASMAWSILTPERCAHWDGHETTFTAGATRGQAPSGDPLEEIWRSYYASIFNPARLKVQAMKSEMPVKYWRNLPEASLIAPLIGSAARTEAAMIANLPTEPLATQQQRSPTMRQARSHGADALDTLREEAAACRACPLWKDATQTVFGEGPAHAPVMLVGEQPGDKEDIAGKPFVGPAGQLLDRALADANVDREQVYVTNAVKHFKFVPRGKRRMHQTPNTAEIRACRPWYERERAAVKPSLIVALGATAAQGVLGKATPINKNRGRLIEIDGDAKVLVTVHPSYLLRLPDEDAKAQEYVRFVEDLKLARPFVHHQRRAS
jgi:uracil-DNA glycosylase